VNIFVPGRRSRQSKQFSGPVRIGDVMSKSVITLSPNDTIAKSVDLMATGDFRHLVITDDEQKVLGVISDRDILGVKGRISEWRVKKIHEVMTPKPITATQETLLSVAVATMIAKKINCLPVIDNIGTLCGIVTSTDMMKFCQNLLESMDKQ
jgi:acetoin utilization protein AcuB